MENQRRYRVFRIARVLQAGDSQWFEKGKTAKEE